MLESYKRLLVRGYKPDILRPLFAKAAAKAEAYTGPLARTSDDMGNHIFLHLKYHPDDPKSYKLQQLYTTHVGRPRYCHPLATVRNHTRDPIGISRMIIAYSRPPNLGNLLSYRKIDTTNGPPVSSYVGLQTRGGLGERER